MAISIIFGVPWSCGQHAPHQDEADGEGEQRGEPGQGQDRELTTLQYELLIAAFGGQDADHACFLWVVGATLRPLLSGDWVPWTSRRVT